MWRVFVTSETITTGAFNTNGYEGLTVYSNGLITLTDVNANLNSPSTSLNGIYLDSGNHDVKITNGVAIGNSQSGVFALIGFGQKLILTNVLSAGNNRWGGVALNIFTDGVLVWN